MNKTICLCYLDKVRLFFYRTIIVIVCSCIISSKAQADSLNPFENRYNISVVAENTFFQLYINGAPIVFHGRFEKRVFTFPIETTLLYGENKIEIDYEPYDLDKRSFTPHNGTRLSVSLSRLQGSVVEDVLLFEGRYSETVEELTAIESESNPPNGELITPPRAYSITETSVQYKNRHSEEYARRLSFRFNIGDPSLGQPPWENSPELQDTPEMRQELWLAYRRLYNVYQNRDVEGYKTELRPYLERTKLALGYENVDDFTAAILSHSPLSGPENTHLKPMMSESEANTARLRWGSDGKLVAFYGTPISYLNANGEKNSGIRVFFCRQPEGDLKVCYIQSVTF